MKRVSVPWKRAATIDSTRHYWLWKRLLVCDQLVEHAPEGIHVAPSIDVRLSSRLLGAHIRRRPEHGNKPIDVEGVITRTRHSARDPEIGDDGVPVLKENVFWLDVEVDDAAAMRI